MIRYPAEIIARKRDGATLTGDEIRAVVDGVVSGDGGDGFDDGQLGAFLMAVCCRGMELDEVAELTLAMRDSGSVLDLSSVGGVKIDKHSTGGVGDKVSLVLAPLVAAAGVPVPMISGRGLGHTGGTLDKLASIPGYRVDLAPAEFVTILGDCGFVMAGAGQDVAPADRRMYAMRDVTGTVPSIPLIVSSILSKKLAAGIDGLVMDVKVGRAAFMQKPEAARQLLDGLVEVGTRAGLRMRALLTDMDTPLGCAVGNALEMREAIDALHGSGPEDLMEIVAALGSEMLVLGGVAEDLSAARAKLREVLASGAALEHFTKNVERQGGDPRVADAASKLLPTAPVVHQVRATTSGYITDIDPLAIGHATVSLGGGRRQNTDTIDARVGVLLHRKRGQPITEGEPWAEVHAADATAAELEVRRLTGAVEIGESAPPHRSLIH